jgi:hypothetical protein
MKLTVQLSWIWLFAKCVYFSGVLKEFCSNHNLAIRKIFYRLIYDRLLSCVIFIYVIHTHNDEKDLCHCFTSGSDSRVVHLNARLGCQRWKPCRWGRTRRVVQSPIRNRVARDGQEEQSNHRFASLHACHGREWAAHAHPSAHLFHASVTFRAHLGKTYQPAVTLRCSVPSTRRLKKI